MELFSNDPGKLNEISSFLTVGKFSPSAYANEVAKQIINLNYNEIEKIASIAKSKVTCGGKIYTCGNGGSTAIAHHVACDFGKGLQNPTSGKMKIHALGSNAPLTSAISNDFGYENVFLAEYQMQPRTSEDLIFLISSSGNSENVLRLARFAREHNIFTVGLSGFKGGVLKDIVDMSVHIPSNVYTIVELVHQHVFDTIFMSFFTEENSCT